MAGPEEVSRPVPTGPAPASHGTEAERLIAKMLDPDALFTTSEVAYLMSRSGRWGYESRVDEENAAYPPPKVFTFGRWYDQARERERADAETRRLVAEERAG